MLGATYEIRVAGLVPRALIQALGDVSVSEHEMRTVLTVSCADLAGLNAFVDRVRELNYELIEVRTIESINHEDRTRRATRTDC